MLSASGAGNRWILPGGVSSIGQACAVRFRGTSAIQVSVAPREGKTFIRIAADRSSSPAGSSGASSAGVGEAEANVGWMIPTLLHLPSVAGLIGAGLVVLGAYLLARGIFAANARGLDRRLNVLADRLEAVTRSAAAGRSRPSTAI